MTSATDKNSKLTKNLENKLEIYKNLEIKLEIYKNLEIKLEIYSYFKLENKLEIFEFFVNGRWSQYKDLNVPKHSNGPLDKIKVNENTLVGANTC